jgi:hypothetical protein
VLLASLACGSARGQLNLIGTAAGCPGSRFALWGGFAFFLLVVAYISFKRTPAFMKQPLYALLHMTHSGQPFAPHDYAAVNLPPGELAPTTISNKQQAGV